MGTIRRQDFFCGPYVPCDTICRFLFFDRSYGRKIREKSTKKKNWYIARSLSSPTPVDCIGLGTLVTRRSPCIRRNNNNRLYFATSLDHPGWPGHAPVILNCIWIRNTYARGCQSASFLWFSTRPRRRSFECLNGSSNATDCICEKPHRRARSFSNPQAFSSMFFALRSGDQ